MICPDNDAILEFWLERSAVIETEARISRHSAESIAHNATFVHFGSDGYDVILAERTRLARIAIRKEYGSLTEDERAYFIEHAKALTPSLRARGWAGDSAGFFRLLRSDPNFQMHRVVAFSTNLA